MSTSRTLINRLAPWLVTAPILTSLACNQNIPEADQATVVSELEKLQSNEEVNEEIDVEIEQKKIIERELARKREFEREKNQLISAKAKPDPFIVAIDADKDFSPEEKEAIKEGFKSSTSYIYLRENHIDKEITKIKALKSQKDLLEKKGFKFPENIYSYALAKRQVRHLELALENADQILSPEKAKLFFANLCNDSMSSDNKANSYFMEKLQKLSPSDIYECFKTRSNNAEFYVKLHLLSYPDSEEKPPRITPKQLSKIKEEYENAGTEARIEAEMVIDKLQYRNIKTELIDVIADNFDNSELSLVLAYVSNHDLNKLKPAQFQEFLISFKNNNAKNELGRRTWPYRAVIAKYHFKNLGITVPENSNNETVVSIYRLLDDNKIDKKQAQVLLKQINDKPAYQMLISFLQDRYLGKPEEIDKVLACKDKESIHRELINIALENEKRDDKSSIFADIYNNNDVFDQGTVKPRTAELCEEALAAGVKLELITKFMLDRKVDNKRVFHYHRDRRLISFATIVGSRRPLAKRKIPDPNKPTELVKNFQKLIAEAHAKK